MYPHRTKRAGICDCYTQCHMQHREFIACINCRIRCMGYKFLPVTVCQPFNQNIALGDIGILLGEAEGDTQIQACALKVSGQPKTDTLNQSGRNRLSVSSKTSDRPSCTSESAPRSEECWVCGTATARASEHGRETRSSRNTATWSLLLDRCTTAWVTAQHTEDTQRAQSYAQSAQDG